MGPKKSKKKTVKKVVTGNDVEDKIGGALKEKMGLNTTMDEDSEVGSTPREDITDGDVNSSMYSEHKEEDDGSSSFRFNGQSFNDKNVSNYNQTSQDNDENEK
jgi:hypothetical protein